MRQSKVARSPSQGDTTITGKRIQLVNYEEKFKQQQSAVINMNALAKKSVEVGDDHPFNGWNKSRGVHNNIDDIA